MIINTLMMLVLMITQGFTKPIKRETPAVGWETAGKETQTIELNVSNFDDDVVFILNHCWIVWPSSSSWR